MLMFEYFVYIITLDLAQALTLALLSVHGIESVFIWIWIWMRSSIRLSLAACSCLSSLLSSYYVQYVFPL